MQKFRGEKNEIMYTKTATTISLCLENVTDVIFRHDATHLQHLSCLLLVYRLMIVLIWSFVRLLIVESDGPAADQRETPGIHTLNPLLPASHWWSTRIYLSLFITRRMTVAHSQAKTSIKPVWPCVSATTLPRTSTAQTRSKAKIRPPQSGSRWPRCARRLRGRPARCPWARTPVVPAPKPSPPPRRSSESGGPWTPSSSGLKRSASGWRIWTQIWRTRISAKYSVKSLPDYYNGINGQFRC